MVWTASHKGCLAPPRCRQPRNQLLSSAQILPCYAEAGPVSQLNNTQSHHFDEPARPRASRGVNTESTEWDACTQNSICLSSRHFHQALLQNPGTCLTSHVKTLWTYVFWRVCFPVFDCFDLVYDKLITSPHAFVCISALCLGFVVFFLDHVGKTQNAIHGSVLQRSVAINADCMFTFVANVVANWTVLLPHWRWASHLVLLSASNNVSSVQQAKQSACPISISDLTQARHAASVHR